MSELLDSSKLDLKAGSLIESPKFYFLSRRHDGHMCLRRTMSLSKQNVIRE